MVAAEATVDCDGSGEDVAGKRLAEWPASSLL